MNSKMLDIRSRFVHRVDNRSWNAPCESHIWRNFNSGENREQRLRTTIKKSKELPYILKILNLKLVSMILIIGLYLKKLFH